MLFLRNIIEIIRSRLCKLIRIGDCRITLDDYNLLMTKRESVLSDQEKERFRNYCKLFSTNQKVNE